MTNRCLLLTCNSARASNWMLVGFNRRTNGVWPNQEKNSPVACSDPPLTVAPRMGRSKLIRDRAEMTWFGDRCTYSCRKRSTDTWDTPLVDPLWNSNGFPRRVVSNDCDWPVKARANS